MRLFSEDSETPLCIISLQAPNFGKITSWNIFFSRMMERYLGKVEHISDLFIPEMREQQLSRLGHLFR